MMKQIIIVLIAGIVLQGIAEDDTNNLVEIITEAINKLREIIDEAINKGQDKLKDAVTKLYEKAQELLLDIKKNIAQIIEKALHDFEETTGQNISEEAKACVIEVDAKLTELNDCASKKAGDCIDKNVRRISDISDEALNGLNNIVGFIGDDFDRLHECKDRECYKKLIFDIVWQTINLPRKIILLIDHTCLTVDGIFKDILLCTADSIVEVAKSADVIIKDGYKCLQNAH